MPCRLVIIVAALGFLTGLPVLSSPALAADAAETAVEVMEEVEEVEEVPAPPARANVAARSEAQQAPSEPTTEAVTPPPPAQDKSTEATASPDAAEDAGVSDEKPDSDQATSEESLSTIEKLATRLSKLLPFPLDADPNRLRNRLDEMISVASQLAILSDNPALVQRARNVQLQALYLYVTRYADANDVPRQLARLRSSARRYRTLDRPYADAIGSMWLAVAEVIEINRSDLSAPQRQAQARQVLEDYRRRFPGPGAEIVSEALKTVFGPGQNATPEPD